MKKCFSEDPEENNLDIDDMNYYSLREQANIEKLDLLKHIWNANDENVMWSKFISKEEAGN